MPRPQWLINIVAIRSEEGVDYNIPTDDGEQKVRNGTLIALVNPGLTEADRERLNNLLNSGAFIAAFLPQQLHHAKERDDRLPKHK